MPVNGDRDTEAFTEIIKDNGSLSCMCHPVTPTHRTTLVNQEGNSQTFFLSWKSGSGKDGSVCLIESMGVQTFSKQEILLLSALLFFFQKRQDGALQLFGSPQERGSNCLVFILQVIGNTGQAMDGNMDACMGITVMNVIGCFLQFLGQFRLTVFLHLFCSHIVQDPEQILCSMLIAAALILTDISDAGVVFIQNGIGLCKSDAPAFFRKHLFGFLYSILFGTWTGRSIALIIPASFWGSWFDILWNGTAFSGRKRSAAADFIP